MFKNWHFIFLYQKLILRHTFDFMSEMDKLREYQSPKNIERNITICSTFARNTLTPPLPPSPITSLSLHPASFPYSLVDDECPAVGWSIPRGPGQFPIMKINRQKILNTEREKMSTLLVRWEVDYGERIGGSPKSGAGLGGAILHVRGKDSAMGWVLLLAFNRVEYSGLCGTSIYCSN